MEVGTMGSVHSRELESVQVHSEWIHVSQANQGLGVNKQLNLLSVLCQNHIVHVPIVG